jgi:hypothetical protein
MSHIIIDQIKIEPSDLTAWERVLYANLLEKLTPYLSRTAQSIVNDGNYDLSKLPEELRKVIIPELENLYIQNTIQFSNSEGDAIPVKPSDIATAASGWAKEYGYDLIVGLTNTTEKLVQNVLSYSMANEGVTLGKVIEQLSPAFGKQRALAIAVTETTRANAKAMQGLQEHYKQRYQVEMVRVWMTNRDELVCPICGPLHKKPEMYWNDKFPDGSPAHPLCRCHIVLRRKSRYDRT